MDLKPDENEMESCHSDISTEPPTPPQNLPLSTVCIEPEYNPLISENEDQEPRTKMVCLELSVEEEHEAPKPKMRRKSVPAGESETLTKKRKLTPRRPGIVWSAGQKLEAMDYMKKWYPAKIVDVDENEQEVLIHFDGWNARFDEWLSMKSDRIRPLELQRKGKVTTTPLAAKKSNESIDKFQVGLICLVRWPTPTSSKYPAKILSKQQNENQRASSNKQAFEELVIEFYDGIEMTVATTAVQTLAPDFQPEGLAIWEMMQQAVQIEAKAAQVDGGLSRQEVVKARQEAQAKSEQAEKLLATLIEKANRAEVLKLKSNDKNATTISSSEQISPEPPKAEPPVKLQPERRSSRHLSGSATSSVEKTAEKVKPGSRKRKATEPPSSEKSKDGAVVSSMPPKKKLAISPSLFNSKRRSERQFPKESPKSKEIKTKEVSKQEKSIVKESKSKQSKSKVSKSTKSKPKESKPKEFLKKESKPKEATKPDSKPVKGYTSRNNQQSPQIPKIIPKTSQKRKRVKKERKNPTSDIKPVQEVKDITPLKVVSVSDASDSDIPLIELLPTVVDDHSSPVPSEENISSTLTEEKRTLNTEEKITTIIEERTTSNTEMSATTNAGELTTTNAEEKTNVEEKTDVEEKTIPNTEERTITDTEEKTVATSEESATVNTEENTATNIEEKPTTYSKERTAPNTEKRTAATTEAKTNIEERTITNTEEKTVATPEESTTANTKENTATNIEEKPTAYSKERTAPNTEERTTTITRGRTTPNIEEKTVINAEENASTIIEEETTTRIREKTNCGTEERLATKTGNKATSNDEEKVSTCAVEKTGITNTEELTADTRQLAVKLVQTIDTSVYIPTVVEQTSTVEANQSTCNIVESKKLMPLVVVCDQVRDKAGSLSPHGSIDIIDVTFPQPSIELTDCVENRRSDASKITKEAKIKLEDTTTIKSFDMASQPSTSTVKPSTRLSGKSANKSTQGPNKSTSPPPIQGRRRLRHRSTQAEREKARRSSGGETTNKPQTTHPAATSRRSRNNSSKEDRRPSLDEHGNTVVEEHTFAKSQCGYAVILEPVDAKPAKAFVVEVDHNQHKCEECGKGFRKDTLLQSHIKHYHSKDSRHAHPGKRRSKTTSICSLSDSEHIPSVSTTPSLTTPCTPLASPVPAVPQSSLDVAAVSLPQRPVESHSQKAPEESEFDDDDRSSEVLNCICGFNEEKDLIIQCEYCCCWQHADCFKLQPNSLPERYLCHICLNTPGVRESSRFLHNQSWHKKGFIPRLNRDSPVSEQEKTTSQLVLKSQKQLTELQKCLQSVGSLQKLITSLEAGDEAEMEIWRSRSVMNPTTGENELIRYIAGQQSTLENTLYNVESQLTALEQSCEIPIPQTEEEKRACLRETSTLMRDLEKLRRIERSLSNLNQ